MNHNQIIEINGVKMEIDMRHATRIDTLQIGSRVKCLVKEYSDHKVYPGVIIGFEPFVELPTIVVAYLKTDYSSASITFKSYNTATKDFEIVSDVDATALEVNKSNILQLMQREQDKLQLQMDEIAQKRNFFLKNFATFFAENQQAPNQFAE